MANQIVLKLKSLKSQLTHDRINTMLLLFLLVAIGIIVLRIFPNWSSHQHSKQFILSGKLLYEISVAYVVAFIFYLLTVFIRELQTRNRLKPYIHAKTMRVIGRSWGVVNEICKASGESDEHYPSKLKTKKMLTKINPKSDGPMVTWDGSLKRLNWAQYLANQKNDIANPISQLLRLAPYLDSTLIAKLVAIEDCSYFSQIDMWAMGMFTNDDFSTISDVFFDYIQLIHRLEKYVKGDLPA